jgi:hypothetical protein
LLPTPLQNLALTAQGLLALGVAPPVQWRARFWAAAAQQQLAGSRKGAVAAAAALGAWAACHEELPNPLPCGMGPAGSNGTTDSDGTSGSFWTSNSSSSNRTRTRTRSSRNRIESHSSPFGSQLSSGGSSGSGGSGSSGGSSGSGGSGSSGGSRSPVNPSNPSGHSSHSSHSSVLAPPPAPLTRLEAAVYAHQLVADCVRALERGAGAMTAAELGVVLFGLARSGAPAPKAAALVGVWQVRTEIEGLATALAPMLLRQGRI